MVVPAPSKECAKCVQGNLATCAPLVHDAAPMAKPLEYNATLVEREDLTSALGMFRIRPDEALPRDGRVVRARAVHGPRPQQRGEGGARRGARPMSIASAPERRDLVEFYIRYVEKPESENPFTHLLWPRKAGDRMYVRVHPTGKFTVPDTVGADDPRLKVCLAAGTGLAPFLSMVRSEINREPDALAGRLRDHPRGELQRGPRVPRGARALAREHGLRYLPTVSRPQA
jgi:ferredoxin--NADP+ reductase